MTRSKWALLERPLRLTEPRSGAVVKLPPGSSFIAVPRCRRRQMKLKFARMKQQHWAGLLLAVLLLAGCRSAYYSAWEKFGVYKRDLLRKRVVAARDDEAAAGEHFKDALTRLKNLYGFQGGNLEKTYTELNRDYERSLERATTVRKRVKDVETVAEDLFAEWDKEIKEISSERLQADSRMKLVQTRQRYEELHAALKKAEKSMDPVLTRFHDQVLYLKHNLNAEAIASLKGETTDIQAEIGRLISEMNTAIAQADKFVASLPK